MLVAFRSLSQAFSLVSFANSLRLACNNRIYSVSYLSTISVRKLQFLYFYLLRFNGRGSSYRTGRVVPRRYLPSLASLFQLI